MDESYTEYEVIAEQRADDARKAREADAGKVHETYEDEHGNVWRCFDDYAQATLASKYHEWYGQGFVETSAQAAAGARRWADATTAEDELLNDLKRGGGPFSPAQGTGYKRTDKMQDDEHLDARAAYEARGTVVSDELAEQLDARKAEQPSLAVSTGSITYNPLRKELIDAQTIAKLVIERQRAQEKLADADKTIAELRYSVRYWRDQALGLKRELEEEQWSLGGDS